MWKHKEKILLLATAFTAMYTTVVFAMDIGTGQSGVDDILLGPRFSGAVEYVNMLGQYVDNAFAMFISWMSFFMASSACLRNVSAATYVQFPKFWDSVHAAHMEYKGKNQGWFEQIKSYGSGGWKNTNGSTLGRWVLHLFLDIKAITEFENESDVDFKQYFMRAIPEAIVGVYLAIFCYNGYYRDVLVLTSSFGSRLTYQALISVKPDEIMYKLTNISGVPTHPSEHATEGTDYIAKLMTTEATGYIASKYPDQGEKKNKELMWVNLDNIFIPYAHEHFSNFSNTKQWKVIVKGEVITQQVDMQDIESADGMNITKHVWFPISTFGLNTSYNQDKDMYLHLTMKFVDKGADDDSSEIDVPDFVLQLPSTLTSDAVRLPSGNKGQITTSAGAEQRIGDWVVHIGKGIIAFELNGKSPSTGEVYGTTNIGYSDASMRKSFPIVGVTFAPGVTPTLTSKSTGIEIPVGGSVKEAWLEIKSHRRKSPSKPTEETESSAEDTDN